MRRWAFAALLAASVGCGADDVSPGPRLDLVAPARARVGEPVDLVGARFCGPLENDVLPDGGGCAGTVTAFVTFGTAPGIPFDDAEEVHRWTSGRITVEVPSLAPGLTQVVVTAGGRATNALEFEVLP